mmetsp:Transcript_110733/g.191939  ORF Transcript_110733/g.191939 Transcript_110733/m.191939 type:complete len:111 (-) Transcript_110733:67-399(-)
MPDDLVRARSAQWSPAMAVPALDRTRSGQVGSAYPAYVSQQPAAPPVGFLNSRTAMFSDNGFGPSRSAVWDEGPPMLGQGVGIPSCPQSGGIYEEDSELPTERSGGCRCQ